MLHLFEHFTDQMVMGETSNKYDLSNFLIRIAQDIVFVIPGFNPTMYGTQSREVTFEHSLKFKVVPYLR